MAIKSSLATGYWVRRLILTSLFAFFAMWAVWDGWVAWPRQLDEWRTYQQYQQLEERQRAGETLFGPDATRHAELRARFPSPPRERRELDIAIQRYVIFPVCATIAVWLGATWIMAARRKYLYHDDGTLVAPEGTFPPERQTGLDLTRWMSKWIAVLEIDGGPRAGGTAVKLDAWIHGELEEVIEILDRRFHPEEHTEATSDEPQPPSDAQDEPAPPDQAAEASEGTRSQST